MQNTIIDAFEQGQRILKFDQIIQKARPRLVKDMKAASKTYLLAADKERKGGKLTGGLTVFCVTGAKGKLILDEPAIEGAGENYKAVALSPEALETLKAILLYDQDKATGQLMKRIEELEAWKKENERAVKRGRQMLSADTREKVKQLHEAKQSIRAIAKELGISTTSVQVILRGKPFLSQKK